MYIKYNKKMQRYEVFSQNSVVRGKKKQPVFVSEYLVDCVDYMMKARAVK